MKGTLTAPKEVLELIQFGVEASWPCPSLRAPMQQHSAKDLQAGLSVMEEYLDVQAVKEIQHHQAKFLVPWFTITKTEPNGEEKIRLIADCRLLNSFLEPKSFKLDHMQQIFSCLRKGMFAIKIDLKHAYFHLGLSQNISPYICMKMGDRYFQFQSACFGLSTLPQKFMMLMKVLLKHWRKQGLQIFVYLDDILLVSKSKKLLQKQRELVINTLNKTGLTINLKKSQLEPTQEVQHLGFIIDFKEGTLKVPTQKLRTVRKELGKLVTQDFLSCRKMAAILGTVRSFLVALPFLRAFTSLMKEFVSQHYSQGWDKKLPIPLDLQKEVRGVKNLLLTWEGRQFQHRSVIRKLHSDASNSGWGGLDIISGKKVQEFWRDKQGLHINIKEISAAIDTVKSLAKKKDHVHLSVDNVVAYSYLKKQGGRKRHLNLLIKPFLQWCHQKRITLKVNLVKSEDMQADSLS